MKPTYEEWRFEVHKRLVHPSAIHCTVGQDERVLQAWHKFGAHPRRVANVLNERWAVRLARGATKEQVTT